MLQACGDTLVLTSKGQGEGTNAQGSRSVILSLCAGDRRRQQMAADKKVAVAVQCFGWRGGVALGGCAQDKRRYFGLKKWSRGYQKHE